MSLFEELNKMMMGEIGRAILAFINEHSLAFLLVFILYSSLLLYSKIIYLFYLPRIIQALVQKYPELSEEDIYALWLREKKTIPFYILVPSHRELWVSPLCTSSGQYEFLHFNKKRHPNNERQFVKNALQSNLYGGKQ